ncbi:hypothetical protein ACIGEZ_31380 [Streptomyces sp. NPDC085481]|uniref:nSTAND1 domain-containing NTPase n=1 Tax=Streptomyces sp. NPDC085481 TaxID=3365727 RepID=UPI0037CD697A
MSTVDDGGSDHGYDGRRDGDSEGGYDAGSGSEAEPPRSYASARDMYIAEQGDVHLYVEHPDGREHHTVGPIVDGCPYPGLSAFTADEADRFFGRRRLLTELGERLAECHAARTPVVVVAPSGAGKTSLLQAGLWQDLDRGGVPVPGSRHWPRVLLTPTAQPVRELIGRLAGVTGDDQDRLAAWWAGDRSRFADRLRRATPEGGRILVVVDQAEELFTLCPDPTERQAFVDLLAWLANPADHGDPAAPGDTRTAARPGDRRPVATPGDHRTGAGPTGAGPAAAGRPAAGPGARAPLGLVVLALRADFYARCAELPWLRTAVQKGQLLLSPMTREELLDAIRLPARAAGLRLEPGLVEILLTDFGATAGEAGGEAGGLPLLAHALRATWQNRSGRLLTVHGYTSTGGVAHALGNSADRVYDRLDPAARSAARRLFLGMVTIGEDTADSRRRVRRDQLLATVPDQEAAEAVLAAFTSRRLLVQERETVSITHEALLTAWDSLHGWINDDRPRNLALQELDAAARAWHATGREPDALHRGKPLDRALAVAPRPARPEEDDPLRRDFLDASLRLRKRTVRNRRRLVAVLVALVLVAGTAAVAAVRQRDAAQAEQRAALVSRIVTQADTLRGADPALAAQLDLVAHRLAPRRDTTMNLLVDGNAILPRTLTGLGILVHLVAYRPDGRVLAAADGRGTLRLWDVSDRSRPRPLGEPLDSNPLATFLTFSPDGRTLASGGFGEKVRMWNVADPARPARLDLPLDAQGGKVVLVAFSPDGRLLAGNGPKGRILFWDLTDPARPALLRQPLTGSTGFRSLAFGPDGRTLTAGGNESAVLVWDLAHPTRPPTQLKPPNPAIRPYRVAYSPDGRTLATSNDKRVWLWNLTDPARPTRLPLYLPATADVNGLAFSPDGQTLAVSDRARTVGRWNVADPAAPKGRPAVPNAVDEIGAIAFSPDGRTLAGGTGNGTLKLWSLPGGTLPAAAYDSRALAFAPDGRTLATGGKDGRARLWSLADPARPRALGEVAAGTDEVTALGFGPDGRTLAVGGSDGDLGLWNVADPSRPRPLGWPARLADEGRPLALSPDGRTLAAAGRTAVTVRSLADPARLAEADGSLTHEKGVDSLTVSSDGRTVGVGYADGRFALWDVTKPRPVAELDGSPDATWERHSVAFAPDGRTLARAIGDTTTLWNLDDPARPTALGTLAGSSAVETLAFAPRGDLLAEGNADGTIRFTDPDRPTGLSRALSSHPGRVEALAFSPDGRTLAGAGVDQPVRLWSTAPDAAARWICAATGATLTPAQWAQYVPGLAYDPPCPAEN